MSTVVQHPTLIDARQREAVTRIHELSSAIEGIVTALVDARFDAVPAEVRDGIVALACINVAARASGRGSIAARQGSATGAEMLDDWHRLTPLGDQIILDATEQVAASRG